ncbi:aspartyl/asparaginyl beta-hydroxylase domain-containing protein [Sphingosinicellaceae bacterium]|nr:aspartyl/asparaginyl beta-hydroxylase domain-containing protein [Sphingosinicellaceae bacterium]
MASTDPDIIDPDIAALDAVEVQADRAASRGDFAAAQALLARVVEASPARVDTWLKLAATRRAARDLPGALAAVAGALSVDPLHFMALLSRANLLEATGAGAEAARTYSHALAQLVDGAPVPAQLTQAVAHARTRVEAYQRGVAAAWDSALAQDPTLSDLERANLERFKSNALRRTRVFHSEPTHYHFPGLVEREFHRRDDVPWLGMLEDATPAILAELTALLEHQSARAEPYISYAPGTPVRQWSGLNNSLDWTAFHLLHGGRVVDENATRCPETMALLARIDQPRIAGRSPNAMFSLLRPHTRIPPHTGIANTRLVCHLPLIVPDGCWFRVGAERREWRVGEAFVFDDTIEHEAANDSDEPRIVLILDLWHPGLSRAECAAVARVMEADEAGHGAGL